MKEYIVKVYEDRTEWQFEGKLHRDNAPAVELSNGTKYWYKEGRLHRLDGPAVNWSSGTKEWWMEGKKLTEEKFNAKKCCPLNVTIDGVEYRLEKV